MQRQGSRQPIRMRTCIATRTRCSDSRMLRVVLKQDDAQREGLLRDERVVVTPDPTRSLPGRGAWIIPTMDNLERARQRRAFERALRVSGQADTRQIGDYIEALETDTVADT